MLHSHYHSHYVSDFLQVQVRVLDQPGKLLSNIHLTVHKPCLDKECPVKVYPVKVCLVKVCLVKVCPVKDCLGRGCLVMLCPTRATARCREARVGMVEDNQHKLVDGTRVNLLRATATDTSPTRARHLRLLERQIQKWFPVVHQTHTAGGLEDDRLVWSIS